MIRSLTLANFRNHKSARINTGGAKNVVITGPNGSGKTAILEAVSLLGGTRGLRGMDITEMVQFGGHGFSVFANLTDDTDVSVSYKNDDANRRAQIDGDNAPLADLGTYLRIVWLTPREDRIFTGPVSERRAFFDNLAAGFDPKHIGRVARLAKLLSERAFALKNNADANWLAATESQIAPIAVSVAAARIQYIAELNYFLTDVSVSVSGMVERLLSEMSAVAAEKNYLEYLAGNRTLVGGNQVIDGAHKSDILVFNKKLNLSANITSTGQQKSAIIDIILGHAKLVRAKTGKTPIVLLDEAAAHLDADARTRMFAELGESGAMVWATGIDANIFQDVPDAVFVACNNGSVSVRLSVSDDKEN